MQMITKQDLQEEHHHQLSLSMSSMSSLHHDQTNQNIFGVPNCLQAFFNTGLCGAILTTIVGSISWRLVASAFPMAFLSTPITYGLLRICFVLESTGVASGAWVLAALHRRVIAFHPDEEYIGTAEERALDEKVVGHGDDDDTDKELGGSDDNTNHKHDYGSNKDDDDSQSPDAPLVSTSARALGKTQGNKRGNGDKTNQSGRRQYNLHRDVNETGDVYDTSPRSTTPLLFGNQQEQYKHYEREHDQLSRAGSYDSMPLVHYGSMQ